MFSARSCAKQMIINKWCEALSSFSDDQGALRAESRGFTSSWGKVMFSSISVKVSTVKLKPYDLTFQFIKSYL